MRFILHKQYPMTQNRAFTLIELLVVISIISFMSSVVFSSVNEVREKALVAKTQITGDVIIKSIAFLSSDTNALPKNDCIIRTRTSYCENGEDLVTNISNLPKWNGPYLSTWPTDPWGSNYRLLYSRVRVPPYRIGLYFQSLGPNKINDDCLLDDICQFISSQVQEILATKRVEKTHHHTKTQKEYGMLAMNAPSTLEALHFVFNEEKSGVTIVN